MLIGGDAFDTDPLHVPQRLAQPDRVGDVAGARLVLVGRPLIQRALQGHVGDHVSAALPRWGFGQHVLAAVEHPDSGGTEDLVAGEDEEIGPGLGHVDRDVRDGLRAVDQHPGTVPVAEVDDRLDRRP